MEPQGAINLLLEDPLPIYDINHTAETMENHLR